MTSPTAPLGQVWLIKIALVNQSSVSLLIIQDLKWLNHYGDYPVKGVQKLISSSE